MSDLFAITDRVIVKVQRAKTEGGWGEAEIYDSQSLEDRLHEAIHRILGHRREDHD